MSIDKRMLLKQFLDWVAKFINMSAEMIDFRKYQTEESIGYLVRIGFNDLVRDSLRDIHRIEIVPKLGNKFNENIISIHQYIPGEAKLDCRPVLFDLATVEETEVEQLLLKCQALLKEVYSEDYDLKL